MAPGGDREEGSGNLETERNPATDLDEVTAETRELETAATVAEIPSGRARTLPPGCSVGRYVVIEKLGSGGMGVVYKAYDPELSRLVAIKLLRLRGRAGKSLARRRARLLREAQALAQLSHPNVIAVHDAGTHEGDVFLAMELVTGTVVRAWLAESDRSYREVLSVMIAAGRGLAAAHEAGLVHRDFKPDNIILGERGRVCVIDFGLARAAGSQLTEDSQHESIEDIEELETRERLLSSPLTRAGSVVGTPVYMPPEQLQGAEVDERADQFAFCVALYEALYGRRPFSGKNPEELTLKMKAGQLREPLEGRKVPAWVRRVVLRGLAPEPENRYPSMRLLLHDLSHDPAVLRRKLVAAVGVGLLAALAVFGMVRSSGSSPSKCQSASARAQEVWNPERAERVEQAFVGTESSLATDTFARVHRVLDEYAEAWAAMHTEACEATHVHGTQSQKLLDLRMACLDRRLQQMDALVQLFAAETDAAVVDRATQAVLSLPRLEPCADAAALTEVIPPPDDARVRGEVAQVRQRLDRANALEAAGRYEEGLPMAANAVDEARRIGYAPLLAEALFRRGAIADKTADPATAEEQWYEAARYAAEAHDDLLAAKCWIELLWNVGYRQTRYEEALVLRRVAVAALARAGDDTATRAQLLATMGTVHIVKGEFDVATEKLSQALELRERLLGPEHITIVFVLDALGLASEYRGRLDDAIGYAERALAIREANLGADHPDLAFSLTNLGEAYLAREDHAKAERYAERALRIRERSLGPDHPALAAPLATLGSAAQEQKRYRTALGYLQRAIRIFETAVGPDQAGLGGYYQRLADLHRAMEAWDEALAAYDRAISVYARAVGDDHPDVAVMLQGKGECVLATGRRADAIALFERALRGCAEAERNDQCVADSQFGLARALWASPRDRRRAMELAEKARDAYRASALPSAKTALERVEAWLSERG